MLVSGDDILQEKGAPNDPAVPESAGTFLLATGRGGRHTRVRQLGGWEGPWRKKGRNPSPPESFPGLWKETKLGNLRVKEQCDEDLQVNKEIFKKSF